ncbi:MAG TPA: 3-hydroxyacyl-CoA dehydrogenase NAD-binding domain-containing protein [Candidatus Udaeobacter sp.]|jgi:3-hydroxyacyl-CoA dehydrogenase/enoyl-CoA hydratase/3-hydroxybutyryl-CoA epimerase|nr:3-hydroxyacyl-CoA dehydrogenase NAD-binding domain-containing protein [Candidatus Udaeobacter sp.]
MIRREIGDDHICVMTFDRAKSGANIFDEATLDQLSEHLDFLENDASVRGLIIASAKKSIFIAGADLKTLAEQAQSGEMRAFIAKGQRIFNRIADLRVPTVAAIHGAAAGGGYEVALACDYRIATDDPATKIGLPETTLGLIPAWGGCTRLARLIGNEKAAEVILNGKLYSAQEALKLGLIDDIAAGDQLLDVARDKLRAGKRKIEGRAPASPASQELPPPNQHGNAAPERAYQVINKTLSISAEESSRLELDAIVELGETESTQNLIRNFFLAEKYKKGAPSKTPADKIIHAAVIGAGVMGSGIAQWLSSRGVSVILRDVGSKQIDRGLANIEKTYANAVKRGLMTPERASEGRARIVASTAPMELRDVQIVIEAAFENMQVKKEVFRELAMEAGPKTIVATNTSALSVSTLADLTVSPEHVIGMHFFNPVSRMKLVEVVIAKQTSDNTRERTLSFARQIGKLPVIVRDSPGFLVNRVLFPYLLDAAELFESGLHPAKVDNALLQWGMPMGPLRLIDEIGVDITIDIANTLEKAYGRRDHVPAVLLWLRDREMLGRKTGAGFYTYDGKTQTPSESLIEWRRGLHGEPEGGEGPNIPPDWHRDPRLRLDEEDLARRLILLMVNEAARCVEEKVVDSAADADYGMILGTGFAPFRGGPLRFAEHLGLKNAVKEMEQLARTEEKFLPCEILKKHARDGTKFYRE